MDWDEKYLNLAEHISSWSKDPSTKIGAVAIGKHGQILSTGYNGFPRKIDDLEDRLNNRELKYKYTIHAEMNCIYNASLTGISLEGSTLYVTGLPICSSCALGVIQAGIKRVVMRYSSDIAEKWFNSGEQSVKMFMEAGVEILYK